MAIHWPARFIFKLLRTLNCFTGSGEIEDVVPAPGPPAEDVPAPPRAALGLPVNEELLPGLPNSLVLRWILPRIPWYSRPLLRATSKAWTFALDNLSIEDRLLARTLSRQYDNKEILHTGHDNPVQVKDVKVKHIKDCRYAIQLYDSRQEIWRNLPPIPCDSLPPTPVFAGFLPVHAFNTIMVDYLLGKMVAASVYEANEEECVAYVWMIDIEGGMWKWEKRQSMYTKKIEGLNIRSNIMDVEGKIYILRYGKYDRIKPMVYNVASDEWMQILQTPSWPPKFFYYGGLSYYSTNVLRDPMTGKISKVVYAMGPYKCTAYLDSLSHTWNVVERR